MKKRKAMLLRNAMRTGFRSKERFLSLFGIIAISTGFFAGLRVTSINMKNSADQYYQDTRLMDLHLISNAGFCGDDLRALSERTEIAQLYGGYTEVDYITVSGESTDRTVHVFSIPENGEKPGNMINQPELTEGRMPQQPDECLIEVNTPGCYEIGDTVILKLADPENSLLTKTEFKAVGKADWSMFTDFQRGTTTIGNGTIDSYLLVPESAFSSDVYTDVFLTLNKTEGMNSYTERYKKIVSKEAEELLQSVPALSAARAVQLRQEAEERLKEARAELDSGLADYETASANLEQAVKDGNVQLASLKEQRDAAEAELEPKRALYAEHEASYLELKARFDEQEEVVNAKEEAANGTLQKKNEQIGQIDRLSDLIIGYRESAITQPFTEDIQTIIDQMEPFNSEEFDLTGSLTAYFTAPVRSDDKANLEVVITNYLIRCKSILQTEIAEAQANLEESSYGRNALEAFRHTVTDRESSLNSEKAELDELENTYQTLAEAYDTKKAELETLDRETRETLLQTKQMLDEGEIDYAAGVAQLDHIADSIKWYAADRNANPGWSSYEQDADRINRISRIFPGFFLLVAALVCFTTMTRMVEEQRTEIGICKALGYSTAAISGQFLLYALLASVLGTAVGTAIGFQVFPRVIFICYGMMYRYPSISCPYHWDYALLCFGAALLCTGVTSLIACGATLREAPVKLMRPKAPRKGRRILLERWRALWSRLGFYQKITLRNLFRYRSRFLMTVIGICGCTALLVTGFGLYHSVSAIVDLQYGAVFTYDLFGIYDESAEHRETLEQTLADTEAVSEYQFGLIKTGTAKVGSAGYEVTITVPEKPEEFAKYVTLRDRNTHKAFTLDDSSVIISEKLAQVLDIEDGASIELDGAARPVRVKAQAENYVYHRVMMTPALYEELFGAYSTNCFFSNLQDGADENAAAETLLKTDALQTLELTSEKGAYFHKLVRALSYVVILIVVCSGLLAFVVLHNLANINIIERKRELATIKVLGFYDKEVSSYVFRENIVSAFCGMLLGLFAGIFLCRYIVRTAEVDLVMFARDIPWYCFVFAAVMTIGFTILVNLILRKKIREIDMAGSMKAIE
ncbi:MAG: hypothetical protein IJ060_04595 [Oscillospiraceae bacterium]|nr:hypothetical protein [Oscillospiraceae bacterium]